MTLLTFLLALLAPAFSVRLTSFSPPVVERWGNPVVTYYIDLRGSDDLPAKDALAAIRAAFQSWEALTCATVRFEELGDAPNPLTNMAVGARANGKNEVHFIEDDHWPFGAYVLGVTVPKVAPNGLLLESDIAFNGLQVQWTVSGNGGMDLESVAVHEIGHFIGVQHNLGPYPLTNPPTMAPWVADRIQNRTLTDDDASAACFLYPELPWTCETDADCPELLSQTFESDDYYSGRFRCGEDKTCSILERFIPGAVGFGERCHRADECRDGLGCHTFGSDALCTRGCTPSASDCPVGYTCSLMSAPLDTLGVCLPTDGQIFEHAAGPEGCLDPAICPAGQSCVPTPTDPNLRRCTTLCTIAAENCPDGQRCHSYGGPGGACFDLALFPPEPEPEPTPDPPPEPEPILEPEPEPDAQDTVEVSPSEPRQAPSRGGCSSSSPALLALFALIARRRPVRCKAR